MQPARLDPDMFQKPFQEGQLSSRVVITFQVMAVSGVSAGHPDTVRTMPKGCEDQFWAHPGRTGQPDNPEVGRILHPAHTGQISRTIAAPVAQESGYFGFPILHRILPQYLAVLFFTSIFDILSKITFR
jgi:hypothetical protein